MNQSSSIVPSDHNVLQNHIRQVISPGNILVPSGRGILTEEATYIRRSRESQNDIDIQDRSVLAVSGNEMGSDVFMHNRIAQDAEPRTITIRYARIYECSRGNETVSCTHASIRPRSLRDTDEILHEPILNHPAVPSQGNRCILSLDFNMRMINLCSILPFLVASSLWQTDARSHLRGMAASDPNVVLAQIAMHFNAAIHDFGYAIALWVRHVLSIENLEHREMTTYDMFSDQQTYVTSQFLRDSMTDCDGEACASFCFIDVQCWRSDMAFTESLRELLGQRCNVCGECRSSRLLQYRIPMLFIDVSRSSFRSSQEIPVSIQLPIHGTNRVLSYRRILLTFHRDRHFIGLIWLHIEQCLALYDCSEMSTSNPEHGVLRHYDRDPPGSSMQLVVYALEDEQQDRHLDT